MSEQALLEEAVAVRDRADCIYTQAEVQAAVQRMGEAISNDLAESNPLVLTVMNGGLVPTSLLVGELHFPFKLDYLHASRYREGTQGKDLIWQRSPSGLLAGRDVLIIDDILDEGFTLNGILNACQEHQPNSLRVAVLTRKNHGRGVSPKVDYVGLDLPDRYVFGCGMDYKGYWRNLPAIYAVAET